jgi:hypothetical protein
MSPDQQFLGIYVTIFLFAFLLNLFLSIAVAFAARKKGRSFNAFFFISFLFSFVIAFIIVASIAPIDTASKREVNRACPFCDEDISPKAILCKHCGQQVEEAEVNEHGDVLNTFLEQSDWQNRFQGKLIGLPSFQGVEKEQDVLNIDPHLVWSRFMDEDGMYLLNGYYASSFSEAVQGWYVCKNPWIRGSRFVVDFTDSSME